MPTKKPPELRLLNGSRPLPDAPPPVELPLVDTVPAAPAWLLSRAAVAEFDRLARILHANRLLTEASLAPLAHLAALHGTLVELWSAGTTPAGNLLVVYRAMISDFGLTPVAQTRLPRPPGGPPGGRFGSNGRRP